MCSTLLLVPRARLAAVLMAGIAPLAAVQAQNAQPSPQPVPSAQPAEPDKEKGRPSPKIERIHIEDRNATVDELRVGGQTQNITVKPKNNAPAYQVMPNDDRSRNQGQSDQSPGESGSRVWWNVFKF
jgi:hypothetical protein